LALRLGKVVFGSAILFVNRVVGLDGHVRKWIAAFRDLVADGKIVSCVGRQRQYNYGGDDAEEYVLQNVLPYLRTLGLRQASEILMR
jgi:hypothetical protein